MTQLFLEKAQETYIIVSLVSVVSYMAFVYWRKLKYEKLYYFRFVKDHYYSKRDGKIKTTTKKTPQKPKPKPCF